MVANKTASSAGRRDHRDSGWFEAELGRYLLDDDSRSHSKLLLLSHKLKVCDDTAEVRRCRRAALEFVRHRLINAASEIQDAFFSFVLQSELVDHAAEVRAALHHLLRSRVSQPIDRLSASIVTAVARTNRPPTAQMLSEVFDSAKAQYKAKPSWTLASVLVSCVHRVPQRVYEINDLIRDLALLDNGEAFDQAVKRRNAMWQSLQPPADAVDIVNSVRRLSVDRSINYPVEQVNRSINSLLGRIHQ